MISYIMGYTNRPRHLEVALRSINESSVEPNDVEVIVIDDGSLPGTDLGKVVVPANFKFDLRKYRIAPARKKHQNPCVPYNIGFSLARGDTVVFGECSVVHAGDVLRHVRDTFRPGRYRSYGCYSSDKKLTERIWNAARGWPPGRFYSNVRSIISPTMDRTARFDCDLAWYNHTKYRPVAYYWASVMSRPEIIDMGGFDLRYAHGRASEDKHLLDRLRIRGFAIEIVDVPYVVHLAHEPAPFTRGNADVYEATSKETTWISNCGALMSDEFPASLAEEIS